MKEDMKGHLGQDRIIVAIIDETDLTPAENDHVKDCPECAGAKQGLALQLFRLSETAKIYTPEQQHKVVLPASEPGTLVGWMGKWIAAPAAVAVCLALIITLSWSHLFTGVSRPYGNVNLTAETAADAKLIAEIDDLEEGILPASLQDIAPDPGSGVDMDEDFLDYMAPADTGSQS